MPESLSTSGAGPRQAVKAVDDDYVDGASADTVDQFLVSLALGVLAANHILAHADDLPALVR